MFPMKTPNNSKISHIFFMPARTAQAPEDMSRMKPRRLLEGASKIDAAVTTSRIRVYELDTRIEGLGTIDQFPMFLLTPALLSRQLLGQFVHPRLEGFYSRHEDRQHVRRQSLGRAALVEDVARRELVGVVDGFDGQHVVVLLVAGRVEGGLD